MTFAGGGGTERARAIDGRLLGAGLVLFGVVVASWIYMNAQIDCPNELGTCDGDDIRGPGLAMFYVTMLLGPLAFVLTIAAFPHRQPPIGRNWILWITALICLAASASLMLAIVGFIAVAALGDGELSAPVWVLAGVSALGAAANGLAALRTLRILRREQTGARLSTVGANRPYVRFAVWSGAGLVLATAVAGGFGFFVAGFLILVAFLLLPPAQGEDSARSR